MPVHRLPRPLLRFRGARLALRLLALVLAARIPVVSAATEAARAFDVPAGEAVETLRQAARQGGVEIVFLAETVRGVRTLAVRGRFTPHEALDRLVRDTGLVVVRDARTGTLSVNRAPPPPPRPGPSSRSEPNPNPPTMKPKTARTLYGALMSLLAAPLTSAQAVAPGAANEPTVTLSPFEVTSTRDIGYTATSSLAGGRLSTELKDTPVSLSVLTREFLDDIAANTFLEAAEWAPNTANVYSYSGANLFNDYQTATRSLGASFQARNYFIWYLNSDAYNTERLDFARGPNSVVFGDANVGGTANISTKRAYRGSLTEVQYRNSDWGGKGRATIDFNRALTDKWYVRLNGLYDHSKLWEDRMKIDREGWFVTTTYQPFQHTSIRAEYEWGNIERVLASTPVDSLSSWDGATTIAAPLTAGNFGGGITRRTADFLTYVPASPILGIVNWRNFGATVGNSRALDVRVPGFSPAGFPVLPYHGWNFTPPNNIADNEYHNYSVFFEQRVGQNLFLEAAYNHQEQYRYVDQLFWEGVSVDVNQFLPDGRANPYFRQRYTEVGNTQRQTQGNKVDDYRVSAAYLLKTGLTDQRFLVSVGRRVDYFELELRRLGRVGNAAARDMFNAANTVRMRRYESELDTGWVAPVGTFNGITTRYGVQNSQDQDQTITYLQAAASGGWFNSRRLKTLVGVRRDTLDRLGNNGVLFRGPDNDITGRGPLVRTLKKDVTTLTIGGVYQVNDGLGLFANFGQSFQPAGLAIDINNNSLPAPENEGIDVGVRLSLLNGRISGSISYYETEQTNVRIAGSATEVNAIWADLGRSDTLPAGYNDTYKLKGRGVELDFTANLTPSWRLLANLAFPETEQSDGYAATIAYTNANLAGWRAAANALTDTALRNRILTNITAVENRLSGFADGRELNNTFAYTANVFTNYAFKEGALRNFTVGGGVNFRGRRLATNRPTSAFDYVYASPYQLVTLTAGYRTKLFGRDVRFQLNVSNALDDEFKRYTNYATYTVNGVSSFEGNRFKIQDPRKISLTTTVRF